MSRSAAMLVCACALAAARAAAADAGLARYAGQHITLVADQLEPAVANELVAMFDLAVPQWCDFFQQPLDGAAKWRVTASVMRNRERFVAAGLLTPDIPRFRHGYALADRLWLDAQTSPYYQRHLLLHEGTHAFVQARFGDTGPPWYAEGTAELLATHTWQSGQLTLGVVPKSAGEVPGWGRIGWVRRAVAAGRGRTLDEILALRIPADRDDDEYGWCWAAALFFSRHPVTRAAFAGLPPHVRSRDVNEALRGELRSAWPALAEQWLAMTQELAYGHDVERTVIDLQAAQKSLAPGEAAVVEVSAERGWQNSGLRLRSGQRYQLRASGRYQIARTDRPWPCEAGGVTIRYHEGRPLGILLGTVRPEDAPDAAQGVCWAKPLVVGLETEWTPTTEGTLFLRVNDSPGELHDNAGKVTVRIRAQ
ncbi:MAG: hypothetical protein K1X74_05525 [Pirellulales bacterium]|nr:hypothetical protein [Pirellulales bacterium]